VGETTRLYREMRVYGVGSDLDEAGLLRIAYDFRKTGRPAEGAEAFLELVTRFPAGPKAELALIRRAEILWSDLGRYDEARRSCRHLLESYPESEWKELAEDRLKSTPT
jgi:TolA-binding protein